MNSRIISILFLLISFSARADKYVFKADQWQKGIHLFAGGGLNASIYNSDFAKQDQGVGLNFKTEVGYYINSQWALEAASRVKFNKVKEYLVWDTLFTGGLKYRFNHFPFTKSKGIYARAFAGKAPTVFYLRDSPEIYRKTKASRIQYDGPVYGGAIGNMYDGANGKVWYVEYGFTYQQLNRYIGVKNDGEIPVTEFANTGNKFKIYSLYVSIGLLVF